MSTPILIADIGGTNARFAIVGKAPHFFEQEKTLNASEYASVEDAIDAYLSQVHIDVGAMFLAAAGPIRQNKVKFPNSHWEIDTKVLEKYYRLPVSLLNDWAMIAYGLSGLRAQDMLPIGGDWDVLEQTRDYIVGLLGPGSGLGVSGLINKNQTYIPLVTEAGHIGFAPETPLQRDILEYLQESKGHRISCERLLSGPGLINLYESLSAIHQHTPKFTQAADIAHEAIAQTDSLCEQSLTVFFEILGQFAGDFALSLGAHDGIYIGGGICQRYPEQLQKSAFRASFENKGRHSPLLNNTPTWLISHKNPGLIGVSIYAQQSNLK